MSDLENIIFKCIERFAAGRKTKRYGIVTSWDATNHRAKVTFQPEGNESGWLPVQALASGNGFGIVAGLTPGDGKTTGDLVEIHYQEGDYENGQIAGRVHNDVDKPPAVNSGEMLLQHASGASIKLTATGVTIVGPVTITGNVTLSGGTLTHDGHDISSTHKHGGVTTGGGNTDVPL